MSEHLLEVRDLKQYFRVSKKYTVKAVDGVSFHIDAGETYGLVGESGSGKSTIGRSIIRLYTPTSGTVTFEGVEISGALGAKETKHLRTRMQMIFQDPMACLNPRKKVGDIIAQGLDIHHLYRDREERQEKVYRIMEKMGLDREHAGRYPHQFSGGQRQRIIQAQVVNLMKDLQGELGAAYLFIAHDLSMVKYISDRIGVLHLGHLVETGTTRDIFERPIHPYTKSLLSAIPHADPRVEKQRVAIGYDYKTSGIDYTLGTYHSLSETHTVLCTDEEFAKWTRV